MDNLFEIVLSNTLVAAVLGLLVAVLSLVVHRPALIHALWLIVLLKLVTPPIVRLPVAGLLSPQASPVPVSPESHVLPQFGDAPVAESTAMESEVLLGISDGDPVFTPAETVRVSSPATVSLPLYQLFAYAWVLGSGLTFLLTAIRVARFRRLLRFCRATSAGLQREVEQFARQMGLRRPPRVCLMPGCVSPMIWFAGRRARLLFPEGLLERLDPQERATLVVHELAHLRRRDHWVRWFEMLLTGLYWWHPLVWWARRGIRDAEEQCCDAWVVSTLPAARHDYAQALIQTIEFLSKARTPVPANATGVGQAQTLKRRLTMIMRGKTKRSISRAGLFGIVAVAALVLPTLPTWGQNDVEDSDQPEPKQAAPKESAPKSGEEASDGPIAPGVFFEPNNPTVPEDNISRPEVEYLPRPTNSERKILEALDEWVTFMYDDGENPATLYVIAWDVQNQYEIPVQIDEHELEDLGVEPGSLFSFQVKGIRLASALHLVLSPLELTYVVEDEVLKITSQRKAQKTLFTRVYLVGDLWTEPKDAEELVEAIQKTVAPGSWGERVGPGTIVSITKSRSLVIRHNYRVHEELIRFLRALRAASDLKDVAKDDRGGLDFENPVLDPFGQPKADRADGQIVYVSSRLGLVWINLGSDDGISSGQRFVVYANSDPGEQMAEIEVVRPRAAHLAEARIMNHNAEWGVFLVEGDLIRTEEEK